MASVNIDIPNSTSLWEVVATIQIAQARRNVDEFNAHGEARDLLECAGMQLHQENLGLGYDPFKYAEAYRALDTSPEPYCGVLATVNGMVGMKISVPEFRAITPSSMGGIIICPFPPKQELALPATVWRALVHYLRGFGKRVYLLGAKGQWQDECGYSEDEILSERPVAEKLSIIAGADLLVGVPNEWLWAGTAWMKKMVYFYPADIPPLRWFPWAGENYGRGIYKPDQIQVPVMIHQLRQLMGMI